MLPEGLLTVTVEVGGYVRPDGSPHAGTVYFTPTVDSIRSEEYDRIILQTVPVVMTGVGAVRVTLLNPHDPSIIPGGGNGEVWQYAVREVYTSGPTITYFIEIPDGLSDGDVISLAALERIDEQIHKGPGSGTGGGGTVIPGQRGPRGYSAYEIAVQNGFEGTEEEWLDSLQGEAGEVGADGADGLSAYEVAVQEGFEGTEEEWLDSLVGPQGPPGAAEAVHHIDDFVNQPLFFLAHRGSGMENPEHTMVAYENAANIMRANFLTPAIEVSAVISADKQLFCLHDPTLDRTTTGEGTANLLTWGNVQNNMKADARPELGENWELQTLSTLREVLDRFANKVIVFLEPKSNPAFGPLQRMISLDYPAAQQSIVWKIYYGSQSSLQWAKDNGFRTWAYIDAGTLDGELDAIDDIVDFWGVPFAMQDSRMEEIVSRGKPVICWEVHRRSDVVRLQNNGVQGMMCSRVAYVTWQPNQFHPHAMLTQDNFASKVHAPGDIGRLRTDPTYFPVFGNEDDVYFEDPAFRSVMLGSLSPVTNPPTYSFEFEMMWPEVPSATVHSGVFFGKPDDQPYGFSIENPTGGYHMVLRGTGNLQLYRHDVETGPGVLLDEEMTDTPQPGEWMTFTVNVTPTTVSITRTDVGPSVTVTSSDTTHRAGAYFGLSTGSVSVVGQTPHWRAISVNVP